MRKFLRHLWGDLLEDEEMGKRVTRAILLGLAGGLGGVAAIAPQFWLKVLCALLAPVLLSLGGLIAAKGTAGVPPPAEGTEGAP